MPKLTDVVKAVIFLIGGFAIIVVGGFMMRSVAKLWESNDDKKDAPRVRLTIPSSVTINESKTKSPKEIPIFLHQETKL